MREDQFIIQAVDCPTDCPSARPWTRRGSAPRRGREGLAAANRRAFALALLVTLLASEIPLFAFPLETPIRGVVTEAGPNRIALEKRHDRAHSADAASPSEPETTAGGLQGVAGRTAADREKRERK